MNNNKEDNSNNPTTFIDMLIKQKKNTKSKIIKIIKFVKYKNKT